MSYTFLPVLLYYICTHLMWIKPYLHMSLKGAGTVQSDAFSGILFWVSAPCSAVVSWSVMKSLWVCWVALSVAASSGFRWTDVKETHTFMQSSQGTRGKLLPGWSSTLTNQVSGNTSPKMCVLLEGGWGIGLHCYIKIIHYPIWSHSQLLYWQGPYEEFNLVQRIYITEQNRTE